LDGNDPTRHDKESMHGKGFGRCRARSLVARQRSLCRAPYDII
jgi:hypothetical protein